MAGPGVPHGRLVYQGYYMYMYKQVGILLEFSAIFYDIN